MKRSKMIKVLVAEFLSRGMVGSTENAYLAANEILNVMENLGMAPPEIQILKDSYDRTNGTYGYWVHEWEEENET